MADWHTFATQPNRIISETEMLLVRRRVGERRPGFVRDKFEKPTKIQNRTLHPSVFLKAAINSSTVSVLRYSPPVRSARQRETVSAWP